MGLQVVPSSLNEVRVDEHEEISMLCPCLDAIVEDRDRGTTRCSLTRCGTPNATCAARPTPHRYEDLFLDLVRSLRKARNAEATRGAFEHFQNRFAAVGK